MKILHTVEFYNPSTGGAQEVVRQLSERLVKLGHEVSVATTKLPERKGKTLNGVRIIEFDISGNAVRGFRGETERYKKFLRASEFDVIMNYAAQQWATDLFFEVIDQVKARTVFVPCGFSGLYDPAYKDYFTEMPDILKKYDTVVCLSNNYRDINFAREHGVKPLRIIPNGAGEDEFLSAPDPNTRRRLGILKDHLLILSVGSHTGVKGHNEALEIFKRAKLKNATLLIIGNDLGGGCTFSCNLKAFVSQFSPALIAARKKIIIKPLSRQETVDAYKVADLFLFPSNIETSPIVLFEAAAAKTPFLSTDVGNAKEITSWTRSGVILPTKKDKIGFSHVKIEKSAQLLEKLAFDKEGRKKMARNGFEAWKKRFTWEKIAKDYESLYQQLLEKGK